MRSDLESNRSRDLNIISGNFGTRRIRAQGNINLNELLPNTVIDPNGADRIVTLCKPAEGVFCLLTNNGIANSLTIKSQAGATIDTLQPGDGQFFYSDGILWYATGLTASDWHVFGPAGPPHSTGLVPDPGPVAGLGRVLYDDGTWKTQTSGGSADAYKQIFDGTNTAVAQGLSQLRLRSSNGSIAIAVTENDPTYGDVANFTANGGAIDHNTLLNYVADQHVAHSGVSITAGAGLTGGGTIAATRTLAIDLNGLAVAAPVLTDSAPFYSASAAGPRKHTFAVLNGILDHNALLNYVANRHIDHSAVTITAGNGLSGGGDITAPRTISLDINGLAVDVPAVGDFIPFFDISQSDLNKTSFTTLNGILDHNALLNYLPDQHIFHSNVIIGTAAGTSGLAGGGNITATRALTVDINSLTVDPTPDLANDYLMSFDASAAALKKVLLNKVGGGAIGPPAVATLGGVFSNAGVANQWIKSINTDGTVTLSQPAFANISGTITAAQLPIFTSVAAGAVPASGGGTTNFLRADGNWAGVGSASITPPAPAVLGGVFSNVGATSKWIKSINTDGSVTLTQPAYTDLTGTVVVPPPAVATLGGVFSNVGAANKWVSAITTSGAVTLTQPAFTDISGVATAAQTPAFTGDVTKPSGSAAQTIAAAAVTLAKMANLAANSVIGNNTASPAVPLALTQAQLTAMINAFTTALPGSVPASGGGTTKFLRADSSWQVPAGGGGATITASDTPPGSPADGSLWWESDSGNLYIRYNDGNSSQWVSAIPSLNVPPPKYGFSAYRTVDQSGIPNGVNTQILWTNTSLNEGGFFNTSLSRWTPPAGKCLITAQLYCSSGLALGAQLILMLYKNGAPVKQGLSFATGAAASVPCTFIDNCNGTDYYEVYVFLVTSTTGNIYCGDATGAYTYFLGTTL